MTTIEVTRCGDCPCYGPPRPVPFSGRCYAAGIEGRPVFPDDPERPEWCPLERGPITIRLRGDDAG